MSASSTIDEGQYLATLTKKCTKCAESRPASQYTKRAKSSDGLAFVCKVCAGARAKAYYEARLKGLREAARAADPQGYEEKRKAQRARRMPKIKAWVDANKEAELVKKRARKLAMDDKQASEYLEKAKEQMRRWRARNLDHAQEWRREWDLKNSDKVRSYANKRRAAKNRPLWVDESAIAAVYAWAKTLESMTGVPHDVDHVYPLQGKHVCGLHVAGNMRAIPSKVNGSKKNKLPGHLRDELWNPEGTDVFKGEVCNA